MKIYITIILFFITCIANSQQRCGTEDYTTSLLEKFPKYKLKKEQTNSVIQSWIQQHGNSKTKTIITIPVVVHVVWKTNNQNISDAQIFSQIDVLNEDFRRTNADTIMTESIWKSVAADCEIEFCLATIDPNDSLTTGITRTQTTESVFSMQGDPVKSSISGGKDAWPNDKYLNIWVCNLGSGLLGYATQPWGNIGSNDGVVIGYDCFGRTGTAQPPYHKGRTTTHEVGHWLNLEHLWGNGNCGNDHCNDTPKQDDENYNCGPFPLQTVACNGTGNNGTMFRNYMDYTSDGCMNIFTNDQKNRMIAAINTKRPNLLNQTICSVPTDIQEQNIFNKKEVIKVIDFLGRTVPDQTKNIPLLYIYQDGSVEKKMMIME